MLADLDLDGVPDLIVGTHRMSSVPDRERGLPQSLPRRPGAAALFLRGVRAKGATTQLRQINKSPLLLR